MATRKRPACVTVECLNYGATYNVLPPEDGEEAPVVVCPVCEKPLGLLTDAELAAIVEAKADVPDPEPVEVTVTLDDLRAQRNALLEMTDWTQLPDAPLSDGDRAAWRSYRDELRSYPAKVADPENAPALPDPPGDVSALGDG